MRRSPLIALLAVVLLAAGACKPGDQGGFVIDSAAPASPESGAGSSGQPSTDAPTATMIPVIISSELAVGDNRVLFSFLDPKTQLPIGSPDLAAAVSFIAPGTTNPTAPVQGTFVWAIEGSRGEYIAHATFPSAGSWKAIFMVQPKGGSQEAIGVPFQVVQTPTVVWVGDHAPDTKTPTLADVGGDVRQISTDPSPDPSFYQVSVDQALARHQPFILVFATPAFCKSAQCGPTLNFVKTAKTNAPSTVAFIHVEPYVLKYANGQLQPVLDSQGNFQTTDVVNKWGLPSEPWVFAVDRNGIVQAEFEGVVSQQELTDAITKIASS